MKVNLTLLAFLVLIINGCSKNNNESIDTNNTTSDKITEVIKSRIDDYKWKRGFDEKKEVIAETERKKKRVAPYTNKGAYMFVTDADDAKSLGKKV